MQKIIMISCFWIVVTPAMQNPTKYVPNNEVGVILAKVISRYKNPVNIKLMNIECEKEPIARDRALRYRFSAREWGARLGELTCVGAGQTVSCTETIPMFCVGPDSRACLLIEDTVNRHEYAMVWVRKFNADGKSFFEFPKIEGTRKACNLSSQILVTLELENANRLLNDDPYGADRTYFVKCTSQISY